jgi:hypothetical protein
VASTEVWGQKFVEITWSTALTDWVCSKNIIPIRAFFTPSAVGDIFVLRENSVTGPRIVKALNTIGDTIDIPLGEQRDESWKPCLKASDQTFSAYGNVILTIAFK